MFNIWEKDNISYNVQADKLFNLPARQLNRKEGQQLIPFLGAGVSISAPSSPAKKPNPDPPSDEQIKEVFKSLGLEHTSAQLFIRMAAFVAVCMDAAEKESPNISDDQLFEKLRRDASPPSAGQLAKLFSKLSTYTAFKQVVDKLKEFFPEGFIKADEPQQVEMLKRLSRITRIADPPDPLTSIASYFENKESRKSLWDRLSVIISPKNVPTLTHKLIAAAAKAHFDQGAWQRDYLILTTNYDCLMEDALDLAGVDYVALATRKSDQKVMVRFSAGVEDAKTFTDLNSGFVPSNLFLDKPKSMVIVCKLHGCLYSKLTEQEDGVIISDNDYVNYITQMNSSAGVIPSYVSNLMRKKPFLFLGYSLSDWNVRSVFETIRKKRGEFQEQDYAVTSYVGDYEQLFFKNNGVTILKTDLNAYSSNVAAELQKLKAINPEEWGDWVDQTLSWIPELQTNEAANGNP